MRVSVVALSLLLSGLSVDGSLFWTTMNKAALDLIVPVFNKPVLIFLLDAMLGIRCPINDQSWKCWVFEFYVPLLFHKAPERPNCLGTLIVDSDSYFLC